MSPSPSAHLPRLRLLGSSPFGQGHFQAAVVFADASGFTALTEALAKQPHGAQELGGCLNGFFGALIDIITRHGGDVLKFSGDALTILWRVAPGDESDEARRAAVFSACCCCEEVQRGAQSFGQTPMPDIRLTLHIGVGFGPLKLLQLGARLRPPNGWCPVGVLGESILPKGHLVLLVPLQTSQKKCLLTTSKFVRCHAKCGFEGGTLPGLRNPLPFRNPGFWLTPQRKSQETLASTVVSHLARNGFGGFHFVWWCCQHHLLAWSWRL
ncbi:unnamed protein product [Effrenium voratum]|nr:unnamed protein product [Effrenium voratum]